MAAGMETVEVQQPGCSFTKCGTVNPTSEYSTSVTSSELILAYTAQFIWERCNLA